MLLLETGSCSARWDDEKGILNSTNAKGDGSFELTIDVPEAVAGLHYIWVMDTNTGDTRGPYHFVVYARIRLSPARNNDAPPRNGALYLRVRSLIPR